MEILDCVARGLNNREVADLLRISEETVRNHLTTVFSKLGVASRAQAIVTARRRSRARMKVAAGTNVPNSRLQPKIIGLH